jgi:hypothetical protein
VIALVLIALLVARQRRSRELKKGFGPAYERTVEERGGDRRDAEAELRARPPTAPQTDHRSAVVITASGKRRAGVADKLTSPLLEGLTIAVADLFA